MASGTKASKDDSEIERLAREEILRDIKKAKARTETLGAVGWRPCPLPKTNKRFLQNTLVGTLQANRAELKRQKQKETETDEDKFTKRSKHSNKEHTTDLYHYDSLSRTSYEKSKRDKQKYKTKSKRRDDKHK
ncbi:protein POLR1D-like [Rhopilema esculentum]|uniref:protein POLR1D-like n=1 Tax=Rhopilema esculentum TaxID=499914 RepID=UPI0031CE59FD